MQGEKPRKVIGWVLLGIGICLPILLAYLGSQKEPPSASWQGLIALASAACQVGAASAFSKRGVVDPVQAQNAVRRLEVTRQRASLGRESADRWNEDRSLTARDKSILAAELSVLMSVVQEDVVQAMDDWSSAMPHAFNDRSETQTHTETD